MREHISFHSSYKAVFDVIVSLLVLNKFDVILRCEWLQKLGDIISKFEKLTMVFIFPNGERQLVGDYARGPKYAALHSIVLLISRGQPTDVLLSTSVEHLWEDSTIHQDITEILEDYLDIFVEPTSLPLLRSHDHQIPLVPRASPTNVRPYRYPYIQKSEIKRLVHEVEEPRIIHSSTNLFLFSSSFGQEEGRRIAVLC